MIRRSALLMILALSLPVLAQQAPKLEPLPEAPPSAPGVPEGAFGERPIRITPGPGDQVEETFVDGKRVLRVTTPGGAVYYLRDDLESTDARRDSLGPRISVPLWVIQEF